MSNALVATIRRIVSSMLAQTGQPRFGLISSVDPNSYTAKVMLQPDGVETGWLPIKSEWIGNGWGLVCVPNPGDQVTLKPHDGDANNLVIDGRVFSQQQTPPAGVPGEFWLIHSTGAFIKLTNAGVIQSNGTWDHTGNLAVTGGVTATQDVVAGEGGENISMLNHTHTSETAGTPTSAPISGT